MLMPASEQTRTMVSASSSTNTATGCAPRCTASAAICAAMLMLTARFAPCHSSIPADGEASVGPYTEHSQLQTSPWT